MEEVVWLALQAVRTAHDRSLMQLAEGERDSVGGCGLVLQVVVHVAGNEQVEAAIAVVIAEGRTVRPVAERYAGLFSNIGEGAGVVVVVEAVLAEVGDEKPSLSKSPMATPKPQRSLVTPALAATSVKVPS